LNELGKNISIGHGNKLSESRDGFEDANLVSRSEKTTKELPNRLTLDRYSSVTNTRQDPVCVG
jgi:hypothetical protein